MTDLEKQLRSSLRRTAPSAGFTGRVLSELRRQQAASGAVPGIWRKMVAWASLRWAAAALSGALVLSVAAYQYRSYRLSQADAELAKQRVILALRIASAELNKVRRLVQERPRPAAAVATEER